MTKQEIIDMFDAMFWIPSSYKRIRSDISTQNIKDFIFDTIMPEVLKSIILPEEEETNYSSLTRNNYSKYIKQKVKELYNINL